jgi:creatinine amidohydrolase
MAVWLEKLTWMEAEKHLTAESVVLIPLGAAAKEHGPHLPLNNDCLLADGLTREVAIANPAAVADLVIAPTINYSFYPAFKEYPGSITLSQETAKQMLVEICRSLHAFGAARFYVLNTGISTIKSLEPAAGELLKDSILLAYTNLHDALANLPPDLISQEGGTHADEVDAVPGAGSRRYGEGGKGF